MPVLRAPDEQNTNNEEQHRSQTCDKPHRDGCIRDQGCPDHQVDDHVCPPEIADQRHRTKVLPPQYFLARGGSSEMSTGSNSNLGSSASGAKYALVVFSQFL